MRFEIKSRFSGAVLFAVETESLRLAVELAVKARAHLARANLAGADLARANLAGADLAGANLAGVDLTGANLTGAYLAGVDLAGAYLTGADLARANLADAKLADAKLRAKDGRDLVLVGARPCLQVGPIGSRRDNMVAFITDAGVYVRAGCFWDTLDAFRRAVAETHGGGLHAREYHSAIALVETHAELWTPAPAELTPAEPTEVQA